MKLAHCFLLGFTVWLGGISPVLGREDTKAAESSGSRREELIRKRKEKLRYLAPKEQISGLEKVMLRLEQGVKRGQFQLRYKDIYPKIGAPEQGGGFGGGIRYFRKDIRSSGLTVESQGLWSIRDYRVAEIQFGRFNEIAPITFMAPRKLYAPFSFTPKTPWQIKRPKAFLYGDFKYKYFPQISFFGLGPGSSYKDATNYLYRQVSGEVVAGYEFSQWFAAGIKSGYLDIEAGPGTSEEEPSIEEKFDDSTAPGIGSRHQYFRLTAAAFINYQDNVNNPHAGGIVGIFYTRVEQTDGNDFDYEWWAVDTRHFIPLGSPQRTLAVRLAASTVRALPGARVPFYLMPSLGGTQALRSFEPFRFRDSKLAYGSVEYRWEPAPAVQFALFYDTGKAYGLDQSLTLKNFMHSWGFGVRFRTARTVVVRIDIAFGQEGNRVNLRSGEAF